MRPKGFDPEQALDRAMHRFWVVGFEAASMQELVDCMGISRQSLYDTFGNKRELFEAALDRYRREWLGPRLEYLEDPALRPIEAMRGFLEMATSPPGEQPAGCLVVKTIGELQRDDVLLAGKARECIDVLLDALTDVIARGQACGEFDSNRPARALAQLALSVISGVNVLNRLPEDGGAYRASIDAMLSAAGALEE